MNKNLMILNEEELMQIDGGGFWLTTLKGVAILTGVGTGGVIVGAAAIAGTYYGLKWIFG